MGAFLKIGARAVAAAFVAAAAFYGASTAEAAPVGAAAGTHVADVAKTNTSVEQVHRRWHHRRYWRPYYGYGYGYRPYYYGYPYRRHYGYYGGGYPYGYYGGYGWRRPGVYLRFGF